LIAKNSKDSLKNIVKNNIKEISVIILLNIFIFILESFSYFSLAPLGGYLHGFTANMISYISTGGYVSGVVNLQLPIDKIIPWFTNIFALYIIMAFIWWFFLPLIIFFSNGRKSLWKYILCSIIMYIIASLIYLIIPTICVPFSFINGQLDTLSTNAMFFPYINYLDHATYNVFGSFPSYHNFWASLLVYFGLEKINIKNTKIILKVIMVIIGILISISTLTLHQHNVLDVILTYCLTGIFMYIISKYNLISKFGKLFKIENLD